MVDFEKLRKHTTYELVYTKDDEELFSVKPLIEDRVKILQMMGNTNGAEKEFYDYLFDSFKRTYPNTSEEELKVVSQYIKDYSPELFIQTLIGFKITTREEIDKKLNKSDSPN